MAASQLTRMGAIMINPVNYVFCLIIAYIVALWIATAIAKNAREEGRYTTCVNIAVIILVFGLLYFVAKINILLLLIRSYLNV